VEREKEREGEDRDHGLLASPTVETPRTLRYPDHAVLLVGEGGTRKWFHMNNMCGARFYFSLLVCSVLGSLGLPDKDFIGQDHTDPPLISGVHTGNNRMRGGLLGPLSRPLTLFAPSFSFFCKNVPFTGGFLLFCLCVKRTGLLNFSY